MIEEVLPGIFRLEIPIPRSPLKATNAYLIRGEQRNLLVDTGQNCQVAFDALRTGLAELSVNMERTDIFLTHMHADHWSLTPKIRSEKSVIYASAIDAARINKHLAADDPLDFLYVAACNNGFAPDEAKQALGRHPGNDPGKKAPMAFCHVDEGFQIQAGDYHFRCICTPGHTEGHVCLYEAQRQLLIAGDHVLGDISPNITAYKEGSNPLGEFLTSLGKIAVLPVALVLPGHRRIFTDCRGRIDELRAHHQRRLKEAYHSLAEGPLTGYEVAARMTWDMVFDSWGEVAPVQKFFATGEALAHLRQLEAMGLTVHQREADSFVYRQTGKTLTEAGI